MLINEIFHSVQGEGSSVGVPTTFVRLQGCNLCCPFCDSLYAVKENPKAFTLSVEETYERVMESLKPDLARNVCITGGEPLLQKEEALKLATRLIDSGIFVEFETNGTIAVDVPVPSKLQAIQWNVSPKREALKSDVLNTFVNNPNAFFKFVINPNDPEDQHLVNFIRAFAEQHRGAHAADRIFLMPECKTKDAYFSNVSDVYRISKLMGVRFSTRIQVFTQFK